jgi:hypothetical protein
MSLSFEESCSRYRDFIAENGYPRDLVWITQKDVLLSGKRFLYVRLPIPESNREHARALFDAAMKEQSGVSFRKVCETEHATLCSVWVPADGSERQYAMCSQKDLKMSAANGESRV